MVHRHREAVDVVVEPVQELAAAVTTSKNWDFTIIFKGAKVRRDRVLPCLIVSCQMRAREWNLIALSCNTLYVY